MPPYRVTAINPRTGNREFPEIVEGGVRFDDGRVYRVDELPKEYSVRPVSDQDRKEW
jgi:hypothetical protein